MAADLEAAVGCDRTEAGVAEEVAGGHLGALLDHVAGERRLPRGDDHLGHRAPAHDLAGVEPGPAAEAPPIGQHLEQRHLAEAQRVGGDDHRLAQDLLEIARLETDLAEVGDRSLLAHGKVPLPRAPIGAHARSRGSGDAGQQGRAPTMGPPRLGRLSAESAPDLSPARLLP